MEVKPNNPFNDFPSPRDWGFTDKVIQWRKDHEGDIARLCTINSHVDEFPNPPATIFDDEYTITNAGAIWLQEVVKWHTKLEKIIETVYDGS